MQKNSYLQDKNFLTELEKINMKIQYIKITILSFDEKPIREIQGQVQSGGSINVNGASALRRTCSFTMFADASTNDLTNIDNIISLNKKIKIEIGYKNLVKGYQKYGDIVWFKGGIFVIMQASISTSTTGATISIQGRDKMVYLNGQCGGTLPATFILHERYEELENGIIQITHPTLFQIIQEMVSEYGGENLSNIYIFDLDQTTKALIKYIGTKTLYIKKDLTTFQESDEKPEDLENWYNYEYGQDIGYQETDFTYPGDLTMTAGSTVTQVLDKISNLLGNYEYFYDIDGHFIFQEKKNYLNNAYTPLPNKNSNAYIQAFSNTKYHYIFDDSSLITSSSNNPNYENIKNDFIVWGNKTSVSGSTTAIRFHLAIDTKPNIDLANKYMWAIYADAEQKQLLFYKYTDTENCSYTNKKLIGRPCQEWREELYRQALERNRNGINQNYDTELLAEWRNLYDTTNLEWSNGWNPDVYNNPGGLNYWLDFLDDGDQLRKYSVSAIGKRSKVINSKTVTTLFNEEIQDILFVENIYTNSTNTERQEKIDSLNCQGQSWVFYEPEQTKLFAISSSGNSAYDEIKSLIYQHLIYNSQITINCIPLYYLEPNNIIYIADQTTGIIGSYVITSMTLPLNYNGTMTIQATEALERV